MCIYLFRFVLFFLLLLSLSLSVSLTLVTISLLKNIQLYFVLLTMYRLLVYAMEFLCILSVIVVILSFSSLTHDIHPICFLNAPKVYALFVGDYMPFFLPSVISNIFGNLQATWSWWRSTDTNEQTNVTDTKLICYKRNLSASFCDMAMINDSNDFFYMISTISNGLYKG